MATNFPTSLDSYTDVVDGVTNVLAAHVNDPHDAIEALEAKVGIDSSAVTTSHDYRITQLRAGTGMTGSSQATAFIPTGSTVPTNGLYLPSANNVAISSNTTQRWVVGSSGNHTFNAPSSGIAVTLLGVSGQASLSVQGGGASSSIALGYNVGLAVGQENIYSTGTLGLAFGTTGNAGLGIYTNAVQRLNIAAAGNFTVGAPTSGNTLTVSQIAGGVGIILAASLNGSTVQQTIDNTSNTSGSTARMIISTAGSSAGDAFTIYSITGVTDFGIGIDNSDSDALVIAAAASLGTSNKVRIPTSGAISFLAGAYTPTNTQSFSATPTFDAALSNYFEMGAMTANVTSVTISNPTGGQTITIRFKQDGTGSRTVAAPSGAKISGSVSATANAASLLTLTYSTADSRWEGAWLQTPA